MYKRQGLRDWMKRIPEEGVTAILPTTVTQMPEVLTEALRNVAAVVKEGYEGAEILGVHFEGPYLDMEYKGAQPPEAIALSLIHISVKLSGQHFTIHTETGAKVSKGDLLIEADIEQIKAAGYDVITPMIVCNTSDYASVEGKTGKTVKPGDDCLEITK